MPPSDRWVGGIMFCGLSVSECMLPCGRVSVQLGVMPHSHYVRTHTYTCVAACTYTL